MKKKKKVIYIIFLFLIYVASFTITIKYYLDNDNFLLTHYLLNNDNNKIINRLISFIANIKFDEPISFIKDNYHVTIKTSSDDIKDITTLPKNNYVKDPNPINVDKPIVYLYNTHQSEEYSNSNNLEYNVKPTVMTASYILREMLNKNNINTIVEENDVLEFLKTNNWNYAASYKVSRMLMEDIKEKEPTLKYYIDLHRDSVSRKVSTITINNKSYAKLLFILGLENNNYLENLKFIEKINNEIDKKYPGLSRGIYKKQGPGVNGVYNQDFSQNTILIEVGGQDNTIDEVYNSCLVISEILTNYIKGDNSES